MVAGATGVHSLNVLSHVVAVYSHVIGNVTVHDLNMEEIFARERRMIHSPATRKYAQVGRNSANSTLHIEIHCTYIIQPLCSIK